MKAYTAHLIIVLLIICGVSRAQEVQGPSPLQNNPPLELTEYITLGEELDYIASWAGFPAGSIKTLVWKNLKEVASQECFLFEATIETNDFVSLFYPVKNTLHSYTEAATGYSRIFTRKIKEEDYQANDRVDYDYDNKNRLGEDYPVINISLIRNNTVEKLPPQSIPGKLSDPLSLAWLIRGLNFNKESSRTSMLISDRFGTGVITLTLISEEVIKLPELGRYDCYVIKPEASTYDSNQNFIKIEGNARIWIEKNTRIILRAEAESPIGQASAVLTSCKNTNLKEYAIPETERKGEE